MMARPTGWQPYRTAAGIEVPSVSEILSLHSAFSVSHIPKSALENAAELGTIVHEATEIWDQGGGVRAVQCSDRHREKARRCFEAYRRWTADYKPRHMEIEARCVSEQLMCGGTVDRVSQIDGKIVCMDLKTSNEITPRYRVQLAAYCLLLEHAMGVVCDEAWIVRLAKNPVARGKPPYEVRRYTQPELAQAKLLFCGLRTLWDIKIAA